MCLLACFLILSCYYPVLGSADECSADTCGSVDTDQNTLLQAKLQVSGDNVQQNIKDEGDSWQIGFLEQGGEKEEVVKELRKIFDKLDADGSGEIGVDDLFQNEVSQESARQSQNESADGVKRDALKSLISEDDLDGNGALSFSEFLEEQLKGAESAKEDELAAVNVTVHDGNEILEEMHADEDRPGTRRRRTRRRRTNTHEEVSCEDLLLSEVDRRRRRKKLKKNKQKNKRQKEWAAKEMLKDVEICSRDTQWVGGPRSRHTRLADWRSWPNVCKGWDQIGFVCYKPCREQHGSGWHAVGPTCWPGCRAGYTNVGALCSQLCGENYRLPQMPLECGVYCADSQASCNKKAFAIITDFALFAANLFPYAKAGLKAAKYAKGAARLAKLQAAISAVARRLKRKAQKKLTNHMKERAKTITKEAMCDIVEGGAEMVAAGVIKEKEPALAHEVEQALEVADPTGIYDVVTSFQAKSCKNLKMEDMPMLGLDVSAPAPAPPPPPPPPPPPTECGPGEYKKWSAGSSKYRCSRCYGSTRRRRALACTSCPPGKVPAVGKDDCKTGGRPPLPTTCRWSSDCWGNYWKNPVITKINAAVCKCRVNGGPCRCVEY